MFMDKRDMLEIETAINIAVTFAQERTKKGWDKHEAADKAGVAYQAYARIENGGTLVSLRVFLRILSLYNLKLVIVNANAPSEPLKKSRLLKQIKVIPPKEFLEDI